MRQSTVPVPDHFSRLVSELAAADQKEQQRAAKREASRRMGLFITGGGAFWVGLAITLTGPETSSAALAFVTLAPGWPVLIGVVQMLAGAGVVALRTRPSRLVMALLVVVAAWYALLSAGVVAAYVGWAVGLPGVEEKPALFAAAVVFTLSLFALKGWQSVREVRADDKG